MESRLLGELSIISDIQKITILMAKSEEELKSLLMEVDEEREKAGLKLSIQKTKITASQRVCVVQSLQSCPTLCPQLTAAQQASQSMGFSRQECWSGVPFPRPGDLPDPGIEPKSLVSPASAGGFFTTSATWEAGHVSRMGER